MKEGAKVERVWKCMQQKQATLFLWHHNQVLWSEYAKNGEGEYELFRVDRLVQDEGNVVV